jgi:hypothetical protein
MDEMTEILREIFAKEEWSDLRVLEGVDRWWKDMKDVSSKFAQGGCCLALLTTHIE